MVTALIIPSSEYLSGLSLVELGPLPLAFRPLGVAALYERIISGLGREFDHIVMTIPEDFDCPPHHIFKFKSLGVSLLRVPETAPAGVAIQAAVDAVVSAVGEDADLFVCYSDTLPISPDLPANSLDFVSVRRPAYFHRWGAVHHEDDELVIRRDYQVMAEEHVCSGLFRFSRPAVLQEALQSCSGDWYAALGSYHKVNCLAVVEVEGLLDLGGHFAYSLGRRAAMAPRSFNKLNWDGPFILKRSADLHKMRVEYAWFNNLPRRLQIHTPIVTDYCHAAEEAGYSVQYLPMQTLSNLLIFGALPSYAWERIFESCNELLTDMRNTFIMEPPQVDAEAVHAALFVEKTANRVETACDALKISGDEPIVFDGTEMVSVRDLADIVTSRIPQTSEKYLSIMHGDYCGSNLLFDSTTAGIKMIDPRGYYSHGAATIYGDLRYDIAKLAHSIVGAYDSIIAGHADVNFVARNGALYLNLKLWQNNMLRVLQEQFLSRRFVGLSPREDGILEIMISLFLTMIPLHADAPERQRAFLANAYRLARDLQIGLRSQDVLVNVERQSEYT